MAASLPQTPIAHRYIAFYGPISAPSANSLRVALCYILNEGATEITLLFASDGGSVTDGIALFTYLRALPIKLNMHAVGVVGSMGVPIFLAVPKENRFASENARFFFHQYNWFYQLNGAQSHAMINEQSLILGDAISWTKDVVKATTQLTDGDFETMKLFEQPVILSPSRAAQVGLISAVVEPSIPLHSEPRIVV